MANYDFPSLTRVGEAALSCSATIRSQAEYFQVDEILPFEPDGEGGHVWLKLRKRGINTDWLANELARFAQVPQVAIGYAGMKDRHAVTTQWFSVKVEGITEPDWSEFETDEVQIVEQTRHGKKLKRGVLSGNIFTLRLTDITGDRAIWQKNLERIQQQGVPNYFAEQRFGHQGNNLHRVDYWFSTGKAPKKRNQKSIYLSAARSWLFNLVLDQRIQQQTWDKAIAGDTMLLAGTKASLFHIDANAEPSDSHLQHRLTTMDIHPTGPLWGRGESLVTDECLFVEQNALADWTSWQQGLEKAGLKQERRSLRLFADDFDWQFLADQQLQLRFFLPAGSYATALMRELALITDASHIKAT